MSNAIASVVTSRLATLHELQTSYGVEDLYDMIEVLQVESHNRSVMNSRHQG